LTQGLRLDVLETEAVCVAVWLWLGVRLAA